MYGGTAAARDRRRCSLPHAPLALLLQLDYAALLLLFVDLLLLGQGLLQLLLVGLLLQPQLLQVGSMPHVQLLLVGCLQLLQLGLVSLLQHQLLLALLEQLHLGGHVLLLEPRDVQVLHQLGQHGHPARTDPCCEWIAAAPRTLRP